MRKKTLPSFTAGFTLIELLVVVSIISVISSIVLSNFQTARAKARDSKRLQEIKSLQIALDLYKNTNGAYPGAGWSGTCDASTSFNLALQSLVTNGFIPSIPQHLFPASNDSWPNCYYYTAGSGNRCNGIPTFPAPDDYIILFMTELNTNYSIPRYQDNQSYPYCIQSK